MIILMNKLDLIKTKKLFSFLLTVLLLYSCADPCEGVSCLNGGLCIEGSCLCPDYYEGKNCELEEREKYFATYNGTTTYSDTQGNTNTYADSKEVSSSNKGVAYIKFNGEVSAVLNHHAAGVFDIPSQSPLNPALADSYFSGSGNFSGNDLTYSIAVENNGEIVMISFTGTK
tara:strand:- start:3012 stop:3527 length:516 start_codon:yes stop_codon:yes gene_type:complete